MEPLLVILGFIVALGFIAMPFMIMSLLSRTRDIEEKLSKVAETLGKLNQPERPEVVRAEAMPPRAPVVVAMPAPTPEKAPAPVVEPVLVEPPPLPVSVPPLPAPVRPVAVEEGPDPLAVRLRELGLLPPAELRGEYAVGSWWAVRVGALLAVAAVIFLGIWLNMRSQLSPIFRLAELVAIAAASYWGGWKLERTRSDLGRVVAASGLGMLQFAAWATYGLEKMRVVDSPAQAAGLQFLVALVVTGVALYRRDRLFAQLAVLFAAGSVMLSLKAGSEPTVAAAGSAMVAVIGGILLGRGGWFSVGVLGLLGSQLCLLYMRHSPHQSGTDSVLMVLLGAFVSFVALWLSERLTKREGVFASEQSRLAFVLGSFLLPALVALHSAWAGGERDRAIVAFALAVLAVAVALSERGRLPRAAEILLVSAVVFAGAGAAWLADPRLVWLVWVVTAAFAQSLTFKFRSELLRWGAEGLALTACAAYLREAPEADWLKLIALAGLGLLLAFRADWERVSPWQEFRRWLGILGVVVVTLDVQSDLASMDTAWPWLVLLVIAVGRPRADLFWAMAPTYIISQFVLVFWQHFEPDAYPVWPFLWAALVAAFNAAGIAYLRDREEAWGRPARAVLAILTTLLLVAAAHHAGYWLLPFNLASNTWTGWPIAITWTVGAALVSLAAWALGRRGTGAEPLAWLSLAFLPGFVLQLTRGQADSLPLEGALFWLVGLGCALHGLAGRTQGMARAGTWLRSLFGTLLVLAAFIAVGKQEGALVSLLWALAAVLAFVVGHWQSSRALRMIGLVGLVAATLRVIVHDIRDLPGRVAACAVVALAFLVIGWLYGRMSKPEPEPESE